MLAKSQAPKPAISGQGESSKGPHRMRIASGGHISQYVAFALRFLTEQPSRPLVLHTIPPSAHNDAEQAESKAESSAAGLPKSLLATPKLISVVELIKRQHMESLQASGKGKGKNKAAGIWQYTTSGLLPHERRNGEEEIGLEVVLAGKTKPALRHSPYLEITLSTRPLGLENTQKDTTCQYVMLRHRRARSGKASARKEAQEKGESEADGVVDRATTGSGEQAKTFPTEGLGNTKGEKGKKRKVGSQASLSSAETGKKPKKLKSRD